MGYKLGYVILDAGRLKLTKQDTKLSYALPVKKIFLVNSGKTDITFELEDITGNLKKIYLAPGIVYNMELNFKKIIFQSLGDEGQVDYIFHTWPNVL